MEYDLRNLPSRLIAPYKSAYMQACNSREDMRHGACVFKTKPLYTASNEAGRCSKVDRFRIYPVNSRHAECACILKQGSVHGLSIVVVRVDSKENPVLSKPCEMCNSFMAYNGIRACYYTTSTSLVKYVPKSIVVYPRKFDVGNLKYSSYDYAC